MDKSVILISGFCYDLCYLYAFNFVIYCDTISNSKQIFTFVPNLVFVILYSFLKEGPQNFMNFRPHKTWTRPW
jgi:hypothetical protein